MRKSFILTVLSVLFLSITLSGQESLFLLTDRDVYSSGDAVQFVAELIHHDTDATCNDSLTLMLLDDSGIILSAKKFKMAACRISGEFTLSIALPEGIFNLVAFTKQMEHSGSQNSFAKTLIIKETKIPGLLISAEPGKSFYKAGDEVIVKVVMYFPDAQLATRTSFSWEAQANGEAFANGRSRTNREGVKEFDFIFPDGYDPALVHVEISAELFGNTYNNSVIIPSENLPLLVNFYPEGGLLIDELKSSIGFTVFSVLGDPVELEGTLIDQYGEEYGNVSTNSPGLGSLEILADAAHPLKLRISKPAGIRKTFDLPKIQSFGVSLSLLQSSAESLIFKADISVDDIFLPVTAVGSKHGVEIFNDRFYLSKEREIIVPVNELAPGLVELNLFDEKGELLARTTGFAGLAEQNPLEPVEISVQLNHEDDHYLLTLASNQPATNLIHSLSIVDQILSPAYNSHPTREYYQTLGIVLANSPFCYSFIDESGIIKPRAIEQFLLTNPTGNNSLNDKGKDENYAERLALRYKKTSLDQLMAIIHLQQFWNDHFLRMGRQRPTFVADNRMKFQAMEITPTKMTQDERIQRQLAQGRTILSVLMTIKPYRLENGKIVFRGVDSFNYQGGAVIVIDGIVKGSDVEVLNSISPYDVASIKASSSIADVIKYTGMENSAGVVEIKTKRASDRDEQTVNLEKYNPTLYWNPDFVFPKGAYSQLSIPKGILQTGYRVQISGQEKGNQY
ncbi:MAG: hypothetical protein HN352_01505 [Bacteroidetes bacterium]|nr:hypothetical protein [Bacteroidota bacterium]MBT3750192.1 hypothetical protein [Bacteroidota bacterium]MBT4400742.1 hypothetical protein [Bacteroidota bacterium]MBT4411019.1 hypothetical protein [Bacteroidota bacterium]MBT5425644.1 hypothetical protein [Bacteroidota bacterium]